MFLILVHCYFMFCCWNLNFIVWGLDLLPLSIHFLGSAGIGVEVGVDEGQTVQRDIGNRSFDILNDLDCLSCKYLLKM